MSDAETPTPPPEPPPADPPPPPPSSGGTSGTSDNRGLMTVLSYLGPLALVPLLVEKDDAEVQWHAKHGLVLFVLWIVVSVVLTVVTAVPVIGCVAAIGYPFVGLAALIIHVICIVKGVNGERFLLPGISQYADRF